MYQYILKQDVGSVYTSTHGGHNIFIAHFLFVTDPKQWSVDDTRKWLCWVAELYQIGDLTACLSFDGRTLCQFSEQDFVHITGTEDSGLKIAAQLDLWKNGMCGRALC